VIDDEDEVRKGIIKYVPWRENGFAVAGESDNGADALELAEECQPDLVITDIKIPFIDGLTFAERLKVVLPLAKTVIISGFDDFAFAKKALGLHVVDYLLKPVNVAELTAALVKTRDALTAEEASRRDLALFKAYYDQTLPALKEHFFSGLLEGRLSIGCAEELGERYGVGFNGACSVVACSSCAGGKEPMRLLSIKKLMDEESAENISTHTLIYADYVIVVANFDSPERINAFIAYLNEKCGVAQKYLGLPMSAGVGYIAQRYNRLDRSYRGALAALDYQKLAGSGRVIYIGDIERDETADISISRQDEESLLSAVRLADADTIMAVVERLLSRFTGSHPPNYQRYQVYVLEIFTALIRIVRMNQIDIDSLLGGDYDIFRELFEAVSFSGVKEKLLTLCLRASSIMRRERENSSGRLVQNARDYAAVHYKDSNFSVESMCHDLHVSPAYFSTIFKRSQNESFVNYLTALRLNEAVRLLTGTDYKTHRVAEFVGFKDPNYFSFVFKKHFGMAPSKYRGVHGENKA
jgi:two-component system response regulator YesN